MAIAYMNGPALALVLSVTLTVNVTVLFEVGVPPTLNTPVPVLVT
jgi:hypothetical protein